MGKLRDSLAGSKARYPPKSSPISWWRRIISRSGKRRYPSWPDAKRRQSLRRRRRPGTDVRGQLDLRFASSVRHKQIERLRATDEDDEYRLVPLDDEDAAIATSTGP